MGENLKIVGVCGASGFIGSHLVQQLTHAGYGIVPLGRELLEAGAASELATTIALCDVVINVAGIPIDHRWSRSYKQQLNDSRAGVARKLVAAIAQSPRVKCWLCASAVGYYPSEGCYDEHHTAFGDGFLAALCQAWEHEARQAPLDVRTVITRFGVVLAPTGGAFSRLARPAQMGVAVITGSGEQFFSWIDIEDLCRAIELLLARPLSGVFNLTAPQRITQRDCVVLIRKHYCAPFQIRISEMLLRAAWGEAADFLVDGSCVLPARLIEAGFEFHTPDLQTFLRRIPR